MGNRVSPGPLPRVNDAHSTPSIYSIENTVKMIIQQTYELNEIDVKTSSWNLLFHDIIELCNIASDYLLDRLPGFYKKGNDCGHTEHVNLEKTTVNTLYLTVLEQFNQQEKEISSNTASSFVHYTIYLNPVWDLGLQHKLLSRNFNKDYSTNLTDIQTYTNNCVCPCSSIFNKWYQTK